MSWDDHLNRCIIFYKITNGLTDVPFEDVLIEVYNGTISKLHRNVDKFVLTQNYFTETLSLAESKSKCQNVHHIQDVQRKDPAE